MRQILRPLLPAALLAVGACSQTPHAPDGTRVPVAELGRAKVCNSPSDQPAVVLLATREDLNAWQQARGVELLPADAGDAGPFAIVEQGAHAPPAPQPVISGQATIAEHRLVLAGSTLGGGLGAQTPVALESPCVLVQLPAGDYGAVELLDAGYRSVAHSAHPPQPMAPPKAAQ